LKESFKSGISFGLTSGVITTLGLIIGLSSGTHSKLAVVGGIVVIAIADALSDALGIHIHEESENVHDSKQVWMSTFATFISKLVTALTFLIPVLLLELSTAVIVSVIWGLLVLSILSYQIAKISAAKPLHVIAEHLIIAIAVVVASHLIGSWVSKVFG
jgi:VIT1/CCC1 family predicted Fe2+/Mn2+ transporter